MALSFVPPELLSTFMFGDDDEFESFLGEDLRRFTSDSFVSSSSEVPRWLLMGYDDDYDLDMASEIEETPTATISIEKLEKVRIKEPEDLVCAVCLEQLPVGSEAVRMPCSHRYHQNCIDRWLKKSHTCPICRYQMPRAISS